MCGEPARTIVVGDDPATVRSVAERTPRPIGYLVPEATERELEAEALRADGGALQGYEEGWLGDPSRFEETLSAFDVDTVVVAFDDRWELLEPLGTCAERGLSAFVPRELAESVLVAEDDGNTGDGLVAVELEPWDRRSRLAKRAFDVTFAVVGLICLAPVVALIALAIKLDSPGPVLYRQRRTTRFGRTFSVPKFRSMVEDAEAETGATLSSENAGQEDSRVTRVGAVLRRTHLDELPQLWTILRGRMSVVGPRPERPELDAEILASVPEWPRRWFVKPGLTGLAQVHDATSYSPDQKLAWDLEYVRHQSVRMDCRIVARQLRIVLRDVRRLLER